jgi:hypothetical protein
MKHCFLTGALTPDEIVYIEKRTGINFLLSDFTSPNWLCLTARAQGPEGPILGVLLGEQVSSFEIHMTTAVDDPAIISRALLRFIFTTFFDRAVRVTAMCRPENVKSINGIRRLGFLPEGCLRLGIEGKWDALIFGMIKSDCRWLSKETSHEIPKAA